LCALHHDSFDPSWSAIKAFAQTTLAGNRNYVTAILRLVPRTVLGVIYRFVARNRYRLFGRRLGKTLSAP
jgi:predicted DCC family thiol-disulfide oxidoreductase YuxK